MLPRLRPARYWAARRGRTRSRSRLLLGTGGDRPAGQRSRNEKPSQEEAPRQGRKEGREPHLTGRLWKDAVPPGGILSAEPCPPLPATPTSAVAPSASGLAEEDTRAQPSSPMFSPSCLLADIGCLAQGARLQGLQPPRTAGEAGQFARWLWVTLKDKWSWGHGWYLDYGGWGVVGQPWPGD